MRRRGSRAALLVLYVGINRRVKMRTQNESQEILERLVETLSKKT